MRRTSFWPICYVISQVISVRTYPGVCVCRMDQSTPYEDRTSSHQCGWSFCLVSWPFSGLYRPVSGRAGEVGCKVLMLMLTERCVDCECDTHTCTYTPTKSNITITTTDIHTYPPSVDGNKRNKTVEIEWNKKLHRYNHKQINIGGIPHCIIFHFCKNGSTVASTLTRGGVGVIGLSTSPPVGMLRACILNSDFTPISGGVKLEHVWTKKSPNQLRGDKMLLLTQ